MTPTISTMYELSRAPLDAHHRMPPATVTSPAAPRATRAADYDAVKLHRGEVASVSSGPACGPDEVLVSARGKSHPKPTDFPLASMPPDVLQTPEGAGAALVGAVMPASLVSERSIDYTDRGRFDR